MGQRNSLTVAELVALRLRDHGVTMVFGQSLPSTVHLAGSKIGTRQIAYRAENAGGIMADGYARVSRKVAVVTAQNGPAATLLVAPLAEALKVSVPIVALVQDVPTAVTDKNAFQEFDHFALFASCAKWVRRLTTPGRTADYVDMAFRAAATGRPGPAVLLLPADVLLESTAWVEPPVYPVLRLPLDRTVADPALIAQAADLLAAAAAPIAVAGGGVHLSGASEALAILQEQAALPVATTNMGKGAVDERHPLSLGMIGNSMGRFSPSRHVRPLITTADLVLLVGTRTNENGTDSWRIFSPATKFIHIDVDGNEIGRNYPAHRLVGDARLTLEALTAELGNRDLSRRRSARKALEGQIAGARVDFAKEIAPRLAAASPIRPERLMAALDVRLDPDTIVVADASYATNWIATYLTARRPGMRFLTPRGLAGIGWGFPMALGAKLASPDSKVVALVGDGAFGHCWAELETARRMGIAITVIVLNNGILGYQTHAEDKKFGAHTDACTFAPVDHAAIACACGCLGIRVTTAGEIDGALDRAMSAGVTALIDVVTEPTAFPPLSLYQEDRPQ
jgi:acetolactate synthase I/II/III large subunit